MKNLFRSLLAAAVLFGAAACTTEDISTSVVGNGNPIEVTFTADLGAMGSRATTGTGENVNKLTYNVYDASNDALLSDLCGTADRVNGVFKFDLVMVKGMTYDIVLWAECETNEFNAYEVEADGKTVTVNYDGAVANDERYDAFYKFVEGFDPTASTPSFTLTRPLAQLNAATDDKDNVEDNGISIKTCAVEVLAYTSFNIEEGTVSNQQKKTFSVANVVGGDLNGNATYEYLAVNYLFVPTTANSTALTNVKYTFTGQRSDNSTVTFTGTEYNDVPLKSNHRTNILGALLTKPTDFVVDIKADFGTPDEVVNVVSTAAGLQQTINEATDGEQTEIVLDGDINLNDLLAAGTFSTRAATTAALTIPADKEITLNLNGKNLTYTTDVWNNDMIQNNGNLTIKDGNVIYTFTGELDTTNSKGNYAINNAGSLTIEANVTTKYKDVNGKVSHALYAINTTGNVVVNNGTILNNNGYAVRVLAKNESNFTVNGGILEGIRAIWLQLPGSDTSVAPQATINVNGGTLIGTGEGDYKLAIYSYNYGNSLANINLNIAGGTLEGDIALTGGKNKEAIETVNISGGTLVDVYSYGDNAAAAQAITITGGTFSSLNPLTYLNSATEVVTLNSNIENAETIAFTGEGSLNLNGKTVSATDTTEVGYELINNSGNLTIEGEGAMTVTATHNNGWNRRSSVVSNCPGGNLTVKNGAVIEHFGGTDMAYGIDNLTNGKGTYAVTTIEGATIKSSYSAVRQFLNGTEATNELYVKAGATLVSPNRAVFFQDPSKNPNTGKLVIEEGASVTGKVHLSVTEGSTEWPVEVSVAASALKNDSQVTYSNVPTGYNVVEENGVWTVTYTCAAKIGETEYNSLQAAIEAVQDGETIVLQRDLNITTPAYGQNALNYTKAVNATIDLNGKTLSADTGNSVLRFNITNSGATSDVVLTIKNGTVTAGENTWCALMALGIDGANAVMNIQNVVVNNSKPGDLGIKAWEKGVINAEGVTVNSTKCAGGFYAVGGEVVLTNCTVNQKGLHTAPYLSMAVAVSSGGKMTINSGTYTTEPTAVSEGYNQGTSHGSWCGGVMNSGGELTINGGTFANGNFGDDALATAARGLIFGDTASVITINDGTFNALKSIIDYQNNLGIQPNPNIVINGGDFSANPAVVASYGGVILAEGKVPAQGANGRWSLVDAITTEAGLVAALAEGGNITLGADITVSDPVVVPQGVTATLDLNGKTLASADEASTYALNNHGTLTIKGNGTINARGIYNGYGNGSDNVATAKLTIENGTFNAKGTNGGAAIFNYGIVEVKGGNFTSIGGYSLNNQTGASMTIADGVTANNGIYASGATLTINGGQINGNRSGCHVVYCWNTTITINGGTFYNYNSGNSTLMAAGTTTMTVNGGTFGIQDGRVPGNGNTWTSCLTDTQNSASMTVNDGTFNGGFRVQAGTTMTINGGSFNDCYGSNYNIYGSAVVKGGSYTDTPAQNFAKKYVADDYELNANGVVVAK